MARVIVFLTGFLALLGIGASVEHLFDADHYNAGFNEYPLTTLIHVIPGGLFLALAILQFNSKLRSKVPAVHRWSGRVAATLGVMAAAAALVIAIVFPFAGLVETVITGPFAVLFGYQLSRGFWLARHRRFAEHREWMIRAMALGTSIATQRLVFVPALFAIGPSNEVASWLSVTSFGIAFAIHCTVAEWWIRATRRTQTAWVGAVS